MSVENDIPDTPTARQTTITLANATCQASTTTRISADAVRMINLLNAKVSTDHVGGNFFFFFLKSIRLISLRLCGGLEPLTEPSLGAVDPRKTTTYEQTV